MNVSESLLCESERRTEMGNMPQQQLDSVLDEMIHAVVNALNTIAAASELASLLSARTASGDASRPLASIEPECMRAARLLRDGRKFMTFEIASEREFVDASALLRNCAEVFDGCVRIRNGTAAHMVYGDPAALDRLFAELLDNAFQFGAHHVEIALDAGVDGELGIDFRDDGPGVVALATRLFDPFFSTDPDMHSGLGLALARRIAAAHGGSVDTEAMAQGACFRVRLPTGG